MRGVEAMQCRDAMNIVTKFQEQTRVGYGKVLYLIKGFQESKRVSRTYLTLLVTSIGPRSISPTIILSSSQPHRLKNLKNRQNLFPKNLFPTHQHLQFFQISNLPDLLTLNPHNFQVNIYS